MASGAKTSNSVEIFSYIARDKQSAVIKGEIKAIEERVVHVFCRICGSNFIGIMREAGGFVAGHNAYHTWEFEKETTTLMEA